MKPPWQQPREQAPEPLQLPLWAPEDFPPPGDDPQEPDVQEAPRGVVVIDLL